MVDSTKLLRLQGGVLAASSAARSDFPIGGRHNPAAGSVWRGLQLWRLRGIAG